MSTPQTTSPAQDRKAPVRPHQELQVVLGFGHRIRTRGCWKHELLGGISGKAIIHKDRIDKKQIKFDFRRIIASFLML